MNNYYLINLIYLLNFFPFFKIIPFIKAEIQPIAALFSIFYFFIFDLRDKRRIYRTYISAYPYIFVLLVYSCISLFFYSSFNELELGFILQSISIFLAPLTVFLVLIDRVNWISLNIFRFSIYSWFSISFLQAFASGLLSAIGISSLLSLVISRFSVQSVGFGRGVAGFSPEPSYAAHIILLMFTLAIFLYRKKRIKKSEWLIMMSMSLFMVVVNQSATLGFFVAVFAASYGLSEFLKGGQKTIYIFITSILLIFVSIVCISIFPQILEIRFLSVISNFVTAISGENGRVFDILEFSDAYGSVRSSAVQVGYESIFHTNGIGLGMGGWGSNSIEIAEQTKASETSQYLFIYGDTPIRPYAYASFVAMDMGLIGLISLTGMLLRMIFLRLKRVSQVSSFSIACLLLFFLGIYYNQPTSLPAHWLFLLIFLEDQGK
jgi:hypothetical protein